MVIPVFSALDLRWRASAACTLSQEHSSQVHMPIPTVEPQRRVATAHQLARCYIDGMQESTASQAAFRNRTLYILTRSVCHAVRKSSLVTDSGGTPWTVLFTQSAVVVTNDQHVDGNSMHPDCTNTHG